MRCVINGLKYDTDKADCLYWWQNMPDERNFKWLSESLYRTPKGRFFLHGEGGAASRYADHCGSDGRSCCRGESIIAMTDDEAKKWLERQAGRDPEATEVLEETFGAVEEA